MGRKRQETMIQSIGFDVDSLSGVEIENACQFLVSNTFSFPVMYYI